MRYCQIPTFWAGISSTHLSYRKTKRIVQPTQKQTVNAKSTLWEWQPDFQIVQPRLTRNPESPKRIRPHDPGIFPDISWKRKTAFEKIFQTKLTKQQKKPASLTNNKGANLKIHKYIFIAYCAPLWAEACGKHTLSLEVFTPGFQTAGICPPQPVSVSHRFSILIRNDRDNAWLFQIRILDICIRRQDRCMTHSLHSYPYNLLAELLAARRKELGLLQINVAERPNRP